jgi:hypothetical protein
MRKRKYRITARLIHAIRVSEDRIARELAGVCRQCDESVEMNPHTKKSYRMCKTHRKADCKRKKASDV